MEAISACVLVKQKAAEPETTAPETTPPATTAPGSAEPRDTRLIAVLFALAAVLVNGFVIFAMTDRKRSR